MAINNRDRSQAFSVELNELCEEALRNVGEASAATKDRLVEDLRLRFEYPGQYAAYLDRFETVSKLRRLHRKLVAHSSDLAEVQQAIARLPKRDRVKVSLDYVEPLGDDFTVPHELPFR
jgi:hypothetical protein